jgi:cytochrome c oxidase assembly protein subunit 15
VWMPEMDFHHGFQLVRELGMTAAGTQLAYSALTAIHWTHRLGALVTFVYVGIFALVLLRRPALARYGAALAIVLVVQIGLGIANILGSLSLPVAIAHNAVAALLLAVVVLINFALSKSPSEFSS